MHTVTIGSSSVNYTLKRVARFTTITMSIGKSGLVVRAPFLMPEFLIKQFVEAHKQWIAKKLPLIQSFEKVQKMYERGEKFLFLGKYYPLTISESPTCLIPKIRHTDTHFEIVLPPLLPGSVQKRHISRLFDNWYKQQSEKIIYERAAHFARVMNLKYQHITLKNVSSLWGSCSRQGNLNFNIALIRAHLPIVEYVVIHELAHLLYHHHQKSFWQFIGGYNRHYKIHVRWLRTHGHKLR